MVSRQGLNLFGFVLLQNVIRFSSGVSSLQSSDLSGEIHNLVSAMSALPGEPSKSCGPRLLIIGPLTKPSVSRKDEFKNCQTSPYSTVPQGWPLHYKDHIMSTNYNRERE